MTAPTRRTAGKLSALLLMTTPLLAACQHQDMTDTVTGWWHGFEGGEIAKLRAPPPGENLRYPHVGRTPTQPPALPTPEARLALTTRLEAQRNLAQRESAAQGALPTIPPPPTPTPAAVTAANVQQSGMTMTTVGQPEAPPVPAAIPATSPAASPSVPAPSARTNKPAPPPPAPEAELPAVVAKSIPPTPPGEFPQIGDLPPPPPQFPGFDLPRDAMVSDPIRPDIDTNTPEGTLIRFQPATDHVSGNPQGEYQHIVSQRGNQRLTIRGFGAFMSADAALAPADQNREIALGLLRARAVARALIERGVPASSITLRGEAIGDGVRVTIGG
ncbi:OmpA family protein [Gluconobacter kanchanaburiensis]|uniref:OmpA-like domain-containing protein n=1 Tax=Gluconobacter kanchanaburiensis NBRC 103587 TaxID=1307948 RepID=A0A511B8Z3_9PROT|nr:hypothetical protein [Gluconobacter kanchanaburiensis]MBF0861085.1 hypothetical protein [Gluconobacter kanchanaburiensis]GBR70349.1 hypothetical protein AA103587_1832 [Gluconobacter kanchanaburiensis NBRC 103587]GEK96784.1 hypothetical protein GKA01_19810 [Gluconobacter kanchanaburiensis NBRC 103587]